MNKFISFLSILFFATIGHAEVSGEFSDEFPTVQSVFNLTHDGDMISIMLVCNALYSIALPSDVADAASDFTTGLINYTLDHKSETESRAVLTRLETFQAEISELLVSGGNNRLILLSHCGVVDKKTRGLYE